MKLSKDLCRECSIEHIFLSLSLIVSITERLRSIILSFITFSLSAASILLGMTIDPNTGEFNWTPTELEGGTDYSVTIIATDDGINPANLSDSETITITVNEINTNPVLAAIGNQSVNEQTELTFTASATDDDFPEQNLTFSLDQTSLDLGMIINPTSGDFNWIPRIAGWNQFFSYNHSYRQRNQPR